MKQPKEAAVLVPIYRLDNGEIIVVFVRRTEGDIHGGQIAFPGGKKSTSDKTLRETALREGYEEIGLPPENVQIIRQLSNIYVSVSNFEITPFLGKIQKPFNWKLSENEIAEIIEVPAKILTDQNLHGFETMNFPHREKSRQMPFIRIGSYKLWGATHRILELILTELKEESLPL